MSCLFCVWPTSFHRACRLAIERRVITFGVEFDLIRREIFGVEHAGGFQRRDRGRSFKRVRFGLGDQGRQARQLDSIAAGLQLKRLGGSIDLAAGHQMAGVKIDISLFNIHRRTG